MLTPNMDIKKEQIYTRRTAHVYKTGNEDSPKRVWLCLHGYAQSAQHFIGWFSHLDLSEDLIICPEGLSKFYVEGVSGRIGASWMTKDNREDEIRDYIEYLDLIVDNISDENSLIVLGFSQGAATACRWAAQTERGIHHLLLWGSVFPPDMNFEAFKNKEIPTTLLFGDNDPYYPVDKKDQFLEGFKAHGLNFSIHEYTGKHKLEPSPLERLFEDIKKGTHK